MAASPEVLLSTMARMPMRAKLGALVAVAAVVAIAAASWMWASAPEYRVLYANLSDRDGGAIVGALSQMNVPYRFTDGGGAILVPAGQVHDVRLRLASQGLPKGSIAGFELMESQKIGVTQFQEQVNYQRGLEGELARSIQSLAAVQGARVHLAIPKPSVFLRDQHKPTASVLVALHPGRTLERSQIAGIVHLVSSSVPDLSPRDISVLDQAGNLLSAPQGSDLQLDPTQLAHVQQIEAGFRQRIIDILEPIVGRNQVRAQVTADIDFSVSESTAESYKPNQTPADAAIRSQQVSETGAGTRTAAAGVPGAASNQPGAAPANAGAAAPAAGAGGRKDMVVNYEIDRTVRHVRSPVGSVRRLSAAVVVNHRRSTDKSGKTVYEPLTEKEMQQVTALVREAIGFSEPRGDSLNVANAPFTVEEQAPVAEVPMWKQPENIATAKEYGRMALFGLLVAYLWFGVLRPFLRQLAAAAAAAPAAGAEHALPAPAGQAQIGNRLESVRQIARQDPKVVANVVRNWVTKE
jgi:flagellar M-ring protein FliF